jgi:hypothetical protein
MDRVLQELDFATVYLDDIIVGSPTYSDHVRHVVTVIKVLNSVGMKISLKKLMLAYPEIIAIGNRLSREGVTLAIEKLEKMEHWTKPVRKLKQLQQRLGFTSYFRDYCPLYSRLMAPLDLSGIELNGFPRMTKS